MVFCNVKKMLFIKVDDEVTILILIDGFLQYKMYNKMYIKSISHNPYFNRWFSAIHLNILIKY